MNLRVVKSHCRAEHVRILIPAALPVVPSLPGGASLPALCDTAGLRGMAQPVPTKECSECLSQCSPALPGC